MKTNSFVNHFLVANIIDTLIPNVRELCLTECEYMLIKAIIVLNDEGLSTEGKAFVSSLRDKLLARDLAEHIKVDHTFNSEMRRVDPLFFELFGDIFQEERQHIADTTSTTQRPAFSQFHKSQAITGTYDPS
uniref:NR LBD domain-containing protein n=1 Tax=Panagrolaimus davidi TaxID=227884 RepID=A0A914QNP7_9BILA